MSTTLADTVNPDTWELIPLVAESPAPPLALSIGMAVYDDPEGIAFTLHSLMAHHAEAMPQCELIVVDNHPGSPQSQRILGMCGWLAASSREVWEGEAAKTGQEPAWTPLLGKMTYIPMPEPRGTSASRERIFLDAKAPAVLCIDGHVLLPSGVIGRLLHWYDSNPETMNLFQGPLVLDNHRMTMEAFDDLWRENMWGTWKHDPRGDDPNGQPFEIQSQGLGLFTCRREAWIRFPEGLQGFGGEEHMMHAMWRQNERKVLCLPFLRWWHLFRDPKQPLPYPTETWDRIRNYVIWSKHLGSDVLRLKDHFVGRQVIPESDWDALVADPIAVVQQPTKKQQGCRDCGAKVADDATLEQLFEQAKTQQSDLNFHVPKLRELAEKCRHITEIGKRSQATVAFLAAQPERLVSHNLALRGNSVLAALKSRAGKTDFIIDQVDCMTVDAETTDLLFIDEHHRADRVWAQLEKYGAKCRRYIVLHDTHLHAEVGQDNMPGILPAVRRWVKERPEWSVIYHTVDQYGLTVLSCNPEDKPKLPSLSRAIWNYAKAIARHVITGSKLASKEEIDRRLAVCGLCDQRVENRCTVCACYLDQGPNEREGKTLWQESDCPLAKW